MNPLTRIFDKLLQALYRGVFYFCLLAFFLGVWGGNLVSLIGYPVFRRPGGDRWLRRLIHLKMNWYVAFMEGSGVLLNNRRVLEGLVPRKSGLMIVANHPSMFDAPLILSTVPDIVCVFKSALKQHLIKGHLARRAGYLSNDVGVELIRQMEERLRAGGTVLIFPEGTRTRGELVDDFNPGYALAALRAHVPVQLIGIRSRTPILSKRLHFLRPGRLPAQFEVLRGPLIEPGTFLNVRRLNAFVEAWFRDHLPPQQQQPLAMLPVGYQLSAEPDGCSASLSVPPDPAYCRGHMPGSPLVPGYVMIAWARELLQASGVAIEPQQRYLRWKFLHPVLPGDQLAFSARFKGDAVDCSFTKSGERAAVGRLVRNQASGE
jgi:1-acyl-sn-glycerol-3-phosphate acyltransferase